MTMLSTHQEHTNPPSQNAIDNNEDPTHKIQTHSRTMLWVKNTQNTNTLLHNAPAAHKKAWLISHILSSSTISQNTFYKDMRTKSDVK